MESTSGRKTSIPRPCAGSSAARRSSACPRTPPIRCAQGLGLPVDYIAVGPVFGTTTKDTGYREVGLQLVRDAAAIVRDAGAVMPIVAIGGITLERAADVIRAGAASVAVISDLLSTRDPEGRVREYLRALA